MTQIVNLWAGPGTGKSTNAALIFGKLKVAGVEAELVHEYAKDLTWEGRDAALKSQPYIMAKQQFHIERVQGQVEVIVTDSPLPFGLIYQGESYTEHLGAHVIKTWRAWDNYNVFLKRDTEHHPYVEAGRNQTQEEAEILDGRIENLVSRLDPEYDLFPIHEGERTADEITTRVLERLGR